VAPELDALLEPESPLLQAAAQGIVRWLFPPGKPSRIPLVAVTGTNGKSTTTTMVHRILQAAGYRPGLATTDGVYDERGSNIAKGDFAGASGAITLFNHSTIDSAAMGGAARFNISNALHAAAACHLMGIAAATVRQALAAFEMSYENMPGRVNFYRELPFDVLLDYAHNPDGVRRLSELVAALDVRGRKIITLTAAAYNPEEIVRGNAAAALGIYDAYICCNYYRDQIVGDVHVANQLARELLESGVAEDKVFIAAHDGEALDMAMSMAAEGDLVVAHASKEKRSEMWQRTIGWRQGE
jgi:UDP-N-acetylmuramyl tripeptide synthase